jgi:hypothetical protein
VPRRSQKDAGDQTAVPGDDHKKRTAVLRQLKKYFTFEVQVLDDKNVRRRFRASNYQSTTRVKPFICTMPMRLDEGWNQIQAFSPHPEAAVIPLDSLFNINAQT